MKITLYLQLILSMFFLSSLQGTAQTYTPGTSYLDENGYVEYLAGNLPIVLSVPHGGYLTPTEIPDRLCDGCVYSRSSYTQEMAREIQAAFFAQTGYYPHVVINLLHRKKFDANRDIDTAADGNATVEQSWYAYHAFIDNAKTTIQQAYGRGLFLDIHGHTHETQRIELGYAISKSELQLSDNDLNTSTYVSESTIQNLVGDNSQNLSHAELLRGFQSLGEMIHKKGYPAVPSYFTPYLLDQEDYFPGGYNTQRYGINDSVLDAIQLACHSTLRFDDIARQGFANDLTQIMLNYMNAHYDFLLKGNMETFTPGNSYLDDNGYVEYLAGNMPIVISAPHGGYLTPTEIPDRLCDGCVYSRSSYTQEMARQIQTAFFEETGYYPHVVINLLHRKKFDANRYIDTAADGNATVEQSWYAYHEFLKIAKVSIEEEYGRGLFLDLHGHAHEFQRIELGYSISKSELQLSDNDLNASTYISKSTIQSLVGDNSQNLSHAELLRGFQSLGEMIHKKGISTVPSYFTPYLLDQEDYFPGGYNTQRHGSTNGENIDAIQMACHSTLRFDDIARQIFAIDFAEVLLNYMNAHYDFLLQGNTETYIPGNVYLDDNGYVEYIAGNLPIVISAPHGGYLTPTALPDRLCDGCSYEPDNYTQELAREMQAAFFEATGFYPHVVINLLHRQKFDANRDIDTAADGNATVEQSWYAYHEFLKIAKNTIEEQHDRGLFLDVHGHGHEIQRLELGYAISKNELQLTDSDLNTPTYVSESTIQTLVGDNIQSLTHAELLRGVQSFGAMTDNGGYPAVPSFSTPFPLDEETYFSGGYNCKRHGSLYGGAIDGIQIECHSSVRFDEQTRQAFAIELAKVSMDFLNAHYIRCSMPSNITSTVISGNCAYIEFDEVDESRKYKLWYREKGVGASWIERLPTVSRFFLNGLTPNTNYELKMKTLCEGTLASDWSAVVDFNTTTSFCDRPISSTTTNITATEATISWSDQLDDDKYKINYRQQGIPNWISTTTNNTNFLLTNLEAGTKYFYKVKTKCPSGLWTNWSSKQFFFTASAIPGILHNREINENDTKGVLLYPNPTSNILNIDFNDTIVEQIRLTDINGQVIKEIATFTTDFIDVSMLQNGIYFINVITNEQQVITKKFVKMSRL